MRIFLGWERFDVDHWVLVRIDLRFCTLHCFCCYHYHPSYRIGKEWVRSVTGLVFHLQIEKCACVYRGVRDKSRSALVIF